MKKVTLVFAALLLLISVSACTDSAKADDSTYEEGIDKGTPPPANGVDKGTPPPVNG